MNRCIRSFLRRYTIKYLLLLLVPRVHASPTIFLLFLRPTIFIYLFDLYFTIYPAGRLLNFSNFIPK